MHCGHGTREHESQGHCFHAAQAEVERLRSRERRVVRVFWRVRDEAGLPLTCVMFGRHVFREGPYKHYDRLEFVSLAVARSNQRSYGGKVYRVTVRRVAKAGRE